jgi:iron(III) transport system substrate-binding protein
MTPAMSLRVFVLLLIVCAVVVGVIIYANIQPRQPGQMDVVLYCAQDQEFAVNALERFRQLTELTVRTKFDTEKTKSVSLFTELFNERDRPRCDVFWNNEIVNTIRLQRLGLLEPYDSPGAKHLQPFPASAMNSDHTWTAFAARARILLVNTDLLKEADRPTSLLDLTHERFRGKVAMAKPAFGTSATQAACLFDVLGADRAKQYYIDLHKNWVQIVGGNKDAAVAVGAGTAVVAVTDTDDALEEIKDGRHVVMIFPDRKGHRDYPKMGTLYIPNTVALVRGAPNPAGGKKLIDFLLSAEVEGMLAESESHQIPFNPEVRGKLPIEVEAPPAVRAMDVNFGHAADLFDEVQKFLREEFARADR